MKKLLLVLVCLCACVGVFAQELNQTEDYIEVNAKAVREVNPDEIYLKIVLNQNDTKGKYTVDQLESQLYDALKKAGIDVQKDLLVSDMSSQLESFLLKKNDGRTTKEYKLKVDKDHLMPVFIELDKAGISQVDITGTRYSKQNELYEELLGEAVVTAKRRATIIASAAGQQVMRMIYAQSYDSSNIYASHDSFGFNSRAKGAVQMEAMPTLEFNKIKVEVTITCRFRYK